MNLLDKSKALIRRFLRCRPVRFVRLWVNNVSFPGNQNVPFANVMGYLLKGIFDGNLWRASKGLAFSLLMAVPPLLIFMFTLIAFLPLNGLQDELLLQMRGILPGNAYDRIADSINDVMGHKHTSLLSIGFGASIILAANAMHGIMMYFSDRNKERRTFVRRYPICILLVFLLYLMVVLVLCTFIGYRIIIDTLISNGFVEPGSFALGVISVGRWIILVLMTMLSLSILYYVIPLKKQRIGFFSPGAIFATSMFILLSWGFRSYLAQFNSFNLLYGSIGTLLVSMLWIFLNCLVVMMGYELNTAILNGKLNNIQVHHRLPRRKKTNNQHTQHDNPKTKRQSGAGEEHRT